MSNPRSGVIVRVAIGVLLIAAVVTTVILVTGGSSGPHPGHETIVPTVLGRTEGAASDILHNGGFEVTVSKVPRPGAPTGRVIEQAPTAGSHAATGTTVVISVTGG